MDLEHSMEKNTESLFGGPYLTYTQRSTLLIICSLVLGSLSVKERGVLCVCVCVCLFSHVQLCEPMDCSPPDFSVHGILQAGKLECVAISYSRGSSQPRDQTYDSCVSWTGRRILYHCTTCEALICQRVTLISNNSSLHPLEFLPYKRCHWVMWGTVIQSYCVFTVNDLFKILWFLFLIVPQLLQMLSLCFYLYKILLEPLIFITFLFWATKKLTWNFPSSLLYSNSRLR